MEHDDNVNDSASESEPPNEVTPTATPEPQKRQIRKVLNLGLSEDGSSSEVVSPQPAAEEPPTQFSVRPMGGASAEPPVAAPAEPNQSAVDDTAPQFNIRPMGSASVEPPVATPESTAPAPIAMPEAAPEPALPVDAEVPKQVIEPPKEKKNLRVARPDAPAPAEREAAPPVVAAPAETPAPAAPAETAATEAAATAVDDVAAEGESADLGEKVLQKMGVFGGKAILGLGPILAKLEASAIASKVILLALLLVTFAAPFVGYVCCRPSAIPMAIVALLVSTSLIGFCRRLRMNKLILHTVLFVLASVILGILVFPGYSTWHANYGSFREKLTNLTVTVDDKTSEHVDTEISVNATTARGLAYVDEALDLPTSTRMFVFAQLVLFSMSVFCLPLAVLMATPGLGDKVIEDGGGGGFMSWLGSGIFRTFYKIGHFSMIRFGKALVITGICAVGLALSGISGYWFVAGIAFAFAILCSLSPVITALLGAVLAFSAGGGWHAYAGLVITVIALAIAEKVLYKKQDTGIGRIMAWMPHLISLALIAGIGYGGWYVWQIYQKNGAMQKAILAANALRQDGDAEGALAGYNAVLNEYPNHPGRIQAYYKILYIRIHEGDYEGAMKLADYLAGYNLEPPKDPMGQAEYMLSDMFDTNGTVKMHRPGLAYQKFIRGIMKTKEASLFKVLGDRLIAVDAKNEWGYLALGRSAFLGQDYATAMQHVRSGLECEDDMLELLLLEAELLYVQGKYLDCEDACDAVLELDDYNRRARELLKLSRQRKGPAAEAAPDGDEAAPIAPIVPEE
ncbi:hypothetical protein BVY04_01825 [bacterium M21]|nr:hypothetical protein BVY04_01825 [bacterium M21]